MKLSEWVAQGADPASLHECVKPLEWDGVADDCFIACDMGYELVVVDTLEMPHHYAWSAGYIDGNGKTVPVGYGALKEAKSAAQAHYANQIIAALEVDA